MIIPSHFINSWPPSVLGILLMFAVLVQMGCIFFVFARSAFYKSKISDSILPPVSIIVSAYNELENLRELLPLLNNQQYSVFEVIVVNDRSKDGTIEFIENEVAIYDKVRFIHIDKDYDHVTPKKYALTTAIRNAKYEVVLLTDADCRPASEHWVERMAEKLDEDKKIVVGFSPYYKESGFLNRLIRFETFYVAAQYLSFALASKPYMGVGRNLMYHKSLFLENKGFYSHLKVMGGDDDLLMNEISTPKNTAICIDEGAFVYSEPKHNWTEWFNQKKRHLSVSKYYKSSNKITLGLLSISQILAWILFIVLSVSSIFVFQSNPLYLYGSIAVFGFYLVIKSIILILINQKLDKTVGWYAIPFLDFVLSVYYVVMGFVAWKNRNTKIRWK